MDNSSFYDILKSCLYNCNVYILFVYHQYIIDNIVKLYNNIINVIYNNNYNCNVIKCVELINVVNMKKQILYKRHWFLMHFLDLFAFIIPPLSNFQIKSLNINVPHSFIYIKYLNGEKYVLYKPKSTENLCFNNYKFVYINEPFKMNVTSLFMEFKNIIFDNNLNIDQFIEILYLTNNMDEKHYTRLYSNKKCLTILDENFKEIVITLPSQKIIQLN